MAGRKSIFTPEKLALILKNFRQTGNLKNSAIRAGISERSFYRWKKSCEDAKSGSRYLFWQEVEHAKADRVALVAVRHHQVALGGFIEMPVYDRFGNLVYDQNGKPVTIRKLMMPNLNAMRRELALHDPETYGRQDKQNAVVCEPPAPQHMRPRDLEPMLISMVRRLKAQGVDFEPAKLALETTATPVDPTTES